MTDLIEMIKRHEGFVSHGYKDSLGYLTIGYGRLIDSRKHGGISEDEAEYLLKNDIERVEKQLNRIEWYQNLDDKRKAVIVNMAFNLGITGLLQFKNMIAAIERKDYVRASMEMLNSRWASQVKRRADELADIMLG